MSSTNKFTKIFFIASFVLLMFISSWATVESLHLLLPEWPVAFFWAGSLIFFFLASWGVKLVTDSLNKNNYMDGRIWRLLGGIVLLTVFWILFSLPTNTHTFFYKSKAKHVLTDELSYTKGKLADLEETKEARRMIDQEKEAVKQKVNSLFHQYEREIRNEQNKGDGKRAGAILEDIKSSLGLDAKINTLTLKSHSEKHIRSFLKQMRDQINVLLETKLKTYDTKLANINRGIDTKEIVKLKNYFNNIQEKMANNATNNDEPTVLTKNNLIRAFSIINKYSDDLKKTYPQTKSLLDYPTPKTLQLDSVVDVWKNFFKGEYKGEGFLYWIIIAMLIDIAGFIMFALAFSKNDY